MSEPLKLKPITLYHHATKSWLFCYDDYCDTHRSEKEGAGYFPKELKDSKYPLSNDHHLQHAQVRWRNCQDPYYITHLTKKMSKLSFVKPDDYDETLERRWCESTKDPKENEPQWR